MLLFPMSPSNQIEPRCRWNGLSPLPIWVKLNTDGSVCGNSKLAGGGGVLLGITSVIMAEQWPLKDGLSLAMHLDFNNINAEVDVDMLVYMLSNLSFKNLMLEPHLNDCGNLMMTFIAQCHVFIGNLIDVLTTWLKWGLCKELISSFCMIYCLWWKMC